jgi:hypothetical protein
MTSSSRGYVPRMVASMDSGRRWLTVFSSDFQPARYGALCSVRFCRQDREQAKVKPRESNVPEGDLGYLRRTGRNPAREINSNRNLKNGVSQGHEQTVTDPHVRQRGMKPNAHLS